MHDMKKRHEEMGAIAWIFLRLKTDVQGCGLCEAMPTMIRSSTTNTIKMQWVLSMETFFPFVVSFNPCMTAACMIWLHCFLASLWLGLTRKTKMSKLLDRWYDLDIIKDDDVLDMRHEMCIYTLQSSICSGIGCILLDSILNGISNRYHVVTDYGISPAIMIWI